MQTDDEKKVEVLTQHCQHMKDCTVDRDTAHFCITGRARALSVIWPYFSASLIINDVYGSGKRGSHCVYRRQGAE